MSVLLTKSTIEFGQSLNNKLMLELERVYFLR
jgi:hypothetical protein